jgi:hypothetical protein
MSASDLYTWEACMAYRHHREGDIYQIDDGQDADACRTMASLFG